MSVKLWAYEPETCRVCGTELEHKPTGRPREFCGGACRVKYHRAYRKWIKACVDAALAKKAEPPHPYPFVTKLPRPERCNETGPDQR